MVVRKTVYAFVDAANLFYGGEKSLGWKIDYKKLIVYLKRKYSVTKVFYYAGIELHGFKYSLLDNKPINLKKIHNYLIKQIANNNISDEQVNLLKKHIAQVKFYLKLQNFGYLLQLKPTKMYYDYGRPIKKANCDVDLTLDLIRYVDEYKEVLLLSGDGDFIKVLSQDMVSTPRT